MDGNIIFIKIPEFEPCCWKQTTIDWGRRMKRIRLPDFLTEYDMKRSTFERLWHRAYDPLPAVKIGGLIFIKLDEHSDWEEREGRRQKRA